ncbi:MAG TPA: DUF1489 family protein [Alphaproteobacteria bacterium]|nr:DUF1489 family protein [Alphaproteobacteria bacterium]
MALHLLRSAMGIADIAALEDIQGRRAAARGGGPVMSWTRRRPLRAAEIVGGGSLYWIMRGFIRARQPVLGFEEGTDEDGRWFGLFVLADRPIPVEPVEQKGFQGWRYLEAAKAPPDLDPARTGDMPPDMVAELKSLGLL